MNQFIIKLKKLLSGRFYGICNSKFKGSGIEIFDSRKFEFGDSVKSINWKLSAKKGELIVNLFKQDTDAELHIFCDVNSNWNAGSDRKNKDYIFEFLSDLFIFTKKNSIFTKFFFYKDSLICNDIKKDTSRFYEQLNYIEEDLKNTKSKYSSRIMEFIEYEKTISKRHIVVIVSDFLDLNQKLYNTLKAINVNNELFVLPIQISTFEGQNFDYFTVNQRSKFNLDKRNILKI